MLNISLDELAETYGCSKDEFSQDFLDYYNANNFNYSVPDKKERDGILLGILRRIEGDRQKIGDKSREEVWEDGWKENLDEFIESDFNTDKLLPKFVRKNQPIRHRQDYIVPATDNFEEIYITLFKKWFFKKFFMQASEIHEFGAGSCPNVGIINSIYPDKKIHVSDFVDSAVKIGELLAVKKNINLVSRKFDMKKPDYSYCINSNDVVFTSGAIEQLAGDIDAFLKFVLEKKPARVVHLEPVIEMYDDNNFVDHLALKFLMKRGYTSNLLTRLEGLQSQGLIKITHSRRLFFGSLFMEGYMYICWEIN